MLTGSEIVGVADNDVAKARSKSYNHHPEKRSARVCPPASEDAPVCRPSRGRRGIHRGPILLKQRDGSVVADSALFSNFRGPQAMPSRLDTPLCGLYPLISLLGELRL